MKLRERRARSGVRGAACEERRARSGVGNVFRLPSFSEAAAEIGAAALGRRMFRRPKASAPEVWTDFETQAEVSHRSGT
ncbi:hypothetical protein EYF80_063188 [Liparis tanakae]|uniref:Uncharacterized protein n=1 Tax=Liparis tanakae TaxID=230148 RepID=A0A4Z2ECP7_9TELE|nr:hypothetical protein EYF80_063188 [Liparis tanakae]